jgi:hypothetical protein
MTDNWAPSLAWAPAHYNDSRLSYFVIDSDGDNLRLLKWLDMNLIGDDVWYSENTEHSTVLVCCTGQDAVLLTLTYPNNSPQNNKG